MPNSTSNAPKFANAIEAAKQIVALCGEYGDIVDHLKLQKLLYYYQGWSLALEGRGAFPEGVEAWQHGPVIEGTYQRLKSFGRGAIVFEEEPVAAADSILRALVATYGAQHGTTLSGLTHTESPWKQHYAPGMLGVTIPTEDIITFFKTDPSGMNVLHRQFLDTLMHIHLGVPPWPDDAPPSQIRDPAAADRLVREYGLH